MKTLYTDQVEIECRHQKISPYDKPIELAFFYYEKRANRDPDNIVAFSKKAILDGLVNAKIIPNDNQKYIKRFTDEWTVDNKNTGVLVIIKEWKDDKRASPLGPVRSN